MKKWYIECPYCANEIKEWAKKCQYCHEFLDKGEIKEKVVVKNKNEEKSTIPETSNKQPIDYFYSIDICIIVCSFAKLRSSGWDRDTRAVVLIIAWLYWVFRLIAWIKVQRTWTTEAWRQRWRRKKIEWIIIAVIWLSIWIILANL